MKQKKIWHEKFNKYCGQYLTIDKELYKESTKYQDLFFFKNKIFGNILSLNDVIKTTEYDEFIYNEMIVHVPMISHGSAKNILIIGGGDGGILRELLKYDTIKKITMVENDIKIIKYCKIYLPNSSLNSFKNSKLKLKINDGFEFIKKNKDKFDIIISDISSKIELNSKFFSLKFYINCKKCLNNNGIFIIQNGIIPIQKSMVIKNISIIKKIFNNVNLYQTFIPSYYGGATTFLYATNNLIKIDNEYDKIYKKFIKYKIICKYYNTLTHINSFILPEYILNNI
ncbi:polyamine aminopropyltransferase [Candidatus Annandia pinicola]|uniref:polyamine aminopropyltransferase n=1 Tax=Candidatus Annandia pinicola TaxID=1345117 RepID=UPI001D00A702|nr:polyamine aminopropyltransferase [Candidatus Annandia pinicola]UDG80345.1 Polyamine aminopropyltransferase [Candidatus Annandia pinicola]